MTNRFSSKALEANLTETRETNIKIPTEQKWFNDLSKPYWGIYKRTQDFLLELNHKYRNNDYVIESLQIICLNDLWLYQSLEESIRAYDILVEIIASIFESKLKEGQHSRLIQVLIRFIDQLSRLEIPPVSIIKKCILLLKKDMENHKILYIKNANLFKLYFDHVSQINDFSKTIEEMIKSLLDQSFDYWEETSLAQEWFASKAHLFEDMNDEKIKKIGHPFFEELRWQKKQAKNWHDLKKILFFNDIADYFREFSKEFGTHLETIHYLYYLLHLPGMEFLKDHLIYDINRNLRNIFDELNSDEIKEFLKTITEEFEELKADHADMVLDCILTLGKEIIQTGDTPNINYFIHQLISLGFNYPGLLSLNEDWQIIGNSSHVKNIRVWLELIEEDPKATRELLAALIVNLKLGGIFISDTDLFQRDVSKLLNSDITPVYREIKQLARIFPVYFREIGAEGQLRDFTTDIDEASRRKDRLIHFMRKQIHIESNNTHVELVRKIINYWYTGKKEPLKDMIPAEIYANLNRHDDFFQGPHKILVKISNKVALPRGDLMDWTIEDITSLIEENIDSSNQERKRVIDLFHIYFLLLEKYSFETEDILSTIRSYNPKLTGNLIDLKKNLKDDKKEEAIHQIYRIMQRLKRIILNPAKSEASENIYYKRHIAADIPSMYGEYVESKFEALGLMYRLEKTASKLMIKLTQPFNTEYITAKTFREIHHILLLFRDGLDLDGISNQGLNTHLDMLKYGLTSPSFSIDQYINIFQFMANDIKQIIREYFFDTFERPMKMIIPQILLSKKENDPKEKKKLYHMESEKFLRDNLSTAFLVQNLDNFITDTINVLRNMMKNYSRNFVESMMTYDPDLILSLLTEKSIGIDNPVFLGAKAYFLKKLIEYGFKVPPGFVITTEVFRHQKTIEGHPDMTKNMDRHLKKHIEFIEKITGQEFGNPENPLFFSIRSGSSISLPGAMKTFLNIGMNDEIAQAFSQQEGFEWTAWDSYRRFLQSWGMAHEIDRDIFDQVIRNYKEKWDVEFKVNFTGKQMKIIAFHYKQVLLDHNVYIETNLFKQLKEAIHCVLNSWSSKSAIYYRDHLQIADEWGTAVLVQKMVLGNLSMQSGTGVIFTSSPFNGCAGIHLYGDFTLCSQGEDVVSGLVNTLPISEDQRKKNFSESPISLESAFPKIYQALEEDAIRLIETYGFVHQEIEFTFESADPKDLYILQTRNQKLKKESSFSSFLPSPQEMELVGHGIGMSGEVLSGRLAFDLEDMEDLRAADPNEEVILVRPDTVPDDIPLIFVCDGLITAKGGVTSHAAVAATSIGKICIVQCRGLIVNETKKECHINGYTFRSGDAISIDGKLGNIYKGRYPIGYIE